MATNASTSQQETFTKLVVAAIDFGTTYSGYAYSFLNDPRKICSPFWSSGESNTVTEKTPTCILFDKDKKFEAFGYEAESKYAELAEDEEHKGWRYFKHFKMMLMIRNNRTLRRNERLKDDQGQVMRALDVFSASIAFLKGKLLRQIRDATTDFRPTDVHWVLTVPAIWEDSAKQFMREATNKAGIEDGQLSLALEPEGAAIYCKEIAFQRVEQNNRSAVLSAFQPGSKFLIIDLGGGTVDITVEMVEANGTLKELYHPGGGPWGGTVVDQKFSEFLIELFGTPVIEHFSKDYKSDELFILRNFEAMKRKVGIVPKGNQILRIPRSLVDCAKGPDEVKLKIKQSRYNDTIELKKTQDRLSIAESDIVDMFTPSWSSIVEHVKKLFNKTETQDIEIMILVGGFAESPLIANKLRHEFDQKQVIVPHGASMAVLKGAVLYGHDPTVISSRKLAYTYGISTAVPFEESKHPQQKKVFSNGTAKCDDVFSLFFEVGQTVIPGETVVKRTFNATRIGDTSASVIIYKTKAKQPLFVSDLGCSRVGTVELTVDKVTDESGLIEVAFLAGHTELKVEATQLGTNNKISAQFHFLR